MFCKNQLKFVPAGLWSSVFEIVALFSPDNTAISSSVDFIAFVEFLFSSSLRLPRFGDNPSSLSVLTRRDVP